ncbi:MAG TPA: hypothetical protein VF405_06905 [Gammaproteobacteria bacterium]
MRWLRLAAPALALAAWLAGSVAQQGSPPPPPAGTPPAGTPPAGTPPPRTPPAGTPQPETPPADDAKPETPADASDATEEDFIPTEELQPDAAITFPVDI